MKKGKIFVLKKIIKNKKNLIFAVIFFLLSFFTLFSKHYTPFLHIILLIFGLIPLVSIIREFSSSILFKILSSGSLLFWIYFFKKINLLEFWGDEIGVIRFASLPFNEINEMAMNYHAAVPPLDYLNLFLWKKIVFFSNIQYLEFFLRIPYFIYHSLAAIIFAFTIMKIFEKDNLDKNSLLQKIRRRHSFIKKIDVIGLLAFLLYFFNPLVFAYSLEIRFFAFSALGSVVTLYLYISGKIDQIKFIPLHLLFALNSVFQFLIIMPYLALSLFEKRVNKKNILLISGVYFVFGILLLKNISSPGPIEGSVSKKLILNAILHLKSIGLPTIAASLFFIISSTFLFIKKPRNTIKWFSILSFYILSISLAAYHKRYFDFYARHYIFTIPIFILLIFKTSSIVKKKLTYLYLTVIFILFGLSWIKTSVANINNTSFFSKDSFGAKEISVFLKNKNKKIYVVDGDNTFDKDVYSFHMDTLDWYLKKYEIEYERSIGKWCEKEKEGSFVVAIKTIPKCKYLKNELVFNSSGISF